MAEGDSEGVCLSLFKKNINVINCRDYEKRKEGYNKKQYVTNRKKDALDDYDIKNFMVDNAVIASFDYLDRSKRDWIITRRYELQDSSPVSERRLGLFLIKKGFSFIHQRPFVINGKIYFLDYYLPL